MSENPTQCVFDPETVKALRATTKLGLSGMLASAQAANVGLCAHPVDPILISGFYGKESRIDAWNLDQKIHIGSLKVQNEDGTSASLRDVALSPNGTHLALAVENSVQIVSLQDGKLTRLQTLECDHTKTQTVAFSPNGSLLVSGDSDGFAVIWHTNTFTEATQLREPSASFDAAAFSYDGHLLALGDQHGNIIVWDLKTGNKRAHFQGHEGKVSALTFASDTYTLATGGFDGKISLWDMAKRRPIGSPQSHKEAVYDLFFDAKDNYLFSSSLDRHIGIWNAQDLSLIDCYADSAPILSMAVQADGSQIAIATQSALKTLFNRRKPPKETLLSSADSLAPGSAESLLVSTLSSSYIEARRSKNNLSSIPANQETPRAQVSGSLPRPDFSKETEPTGSKTSMVLERPSFPSRKPAQPAPKPSTDPRARIQHAPRPGPSPKPRPKPKQPPKASPPSPNAAAPPPQPRQKPKQQPKTPPPTNQDEFEPSFVNPNAAALFSAALDSMETDSQGAIGATDEQHAALKNNHEDLPKAIDIDDEFGSDPIASKPSQAHDEDNAPSKPKKPTSTIDREAMQRAEEISKRSSDFYKKGIVISLIVGLCCGPVGLLFRPAPETHEEYSGRLETIDKSIETLVATENEEFKEEEERLDHILLDTRLASEEPDKDPKVARATKDLTDERTRHTTTLQDLKNKREQQVEALREELQAGYLKYVLGGIVVGFSLALIIAAILIRFVFKADDEKYSTKAGSQTTKISS